MKLILTLTHLSALMIGILLTIIIIISSPIDYSRQDNHSIKVEMISGKEKFYADKIKFKKTKYKGLYLASLEYRRKK